MVKPSDVSPAESAMPWDLFIYKDTLLTVVDLQYTLSYCTVISSLSVHLYALLCLLNAISISSDSHTL